MLVKTIGAQPATVMDLEPLALPALRIQAQAARAHTQGLEIIDGVCIVTARREDVSPRQALLLRLPKGAREWRVWDITPRRTEDEPLLDHPGGFQSDGTHLWIPIAESRRGGRSIIRRYALTDLANDGKLEPVFEFPVDDHIGAVAVAATRTRLLGASWDTESVYVWDLQGRLLNKLSTTALQQLQLGIADQTGPKGLAVQDWKVVGHRLWASGLVPADSGGRFSRLMLFDHPLEHQTAGVSIELPPHPGVGLAREGMAVAGEFIYFLPGDLGATNQFFRIPLAKFGIRLDTH